MNSAFEGYWGIDVSKNWLDIAVDNKVIRLDQTIEAIKEFIKNHALENKKILAVLESTGGYEQLAATCLNESNITVHIAHPNKVKAYARAKGCLAKTDKIDAMLLKDYGSFINIEEIRDLPNKKQYKLQLLGSRLAQLKELHHQESCRKGIASEAVVKESIKTMLELLKKEIESLQKNILIIIKGDMELKNTYELLCSMKGVGPTLAMILITDLPELGHANKKEIAALVGVAPITNQSGLRAGKAMTRYGRSSVRKVLYMGALTACRYNAKLKLFYEKLRATGKPAKVAIVAVMRKMIVILNSMIASKTAFVA